MPFAEVTELLMEQYLQMPLFNSKYLVVPFPGDSLNSTEVVFQSQSYLSRNKRGKRDIPSTS